MAGLWIWLILPGLSLTLGRDMRNRGQIFWEWADPDLHFRNFDERMADGSLINIQVRVSKANQIQLFLGIYAQDGELLLEEGYLDCKDQTMTTAMSWALQRAYSWMTTGKLSDR